MLIFSGFASVDAADKWKERNIRMLHLVAGLIMITLGVAIVMGWV